MNKKISFANFIPAIISLICALGVMSLFHACGIKDDGTWMKCHAAQVASFYLSLALTFILILPAIFFRRILKIIFWILGLAGGIILFLIPGVLKPMCMMQTMRCYTVMQPFVRICSALEIIFCIVFIIKSFYKNQNR